MTTFATLFSGGELAGVGMRNAGLVHRWGIELDDAIAAVARLNGFNVITADILDIDPASLEPVDALHASPPCARASTANQSAELNDDGTKEAELDIELGKKVAEFIDVLRPRWFTLENVYAYRHFKAFGLITTALNRGGYFWDYDNVNAANFAVPQTRRRLILRAVRGALLPPLPAPEPWVGWMAAIEDLIPTLPDSKFAKWQEARLPAELTDSVITRPAKFNPAEERGNGYYFSDQAAPTVMPYNRVQRAFIVDQNYSNSNSGGQERILSTRQDNQPIFTLGAGNGDKREIRAWLVDGDGNRSRDMTVLDGTDPSMTVQAWHGRRPVNSPRAWLSQGRVVKLTPRALARLQSVPDSYRLPTNREQLESFAAFLLGIPESLAHFVIERETTDNGLACKVIGNGVACLMIEKIYRQLVAGG